jgi:hypothetical protein
LASTSPVGRIGGLVLQKELVMQRLRVSGDLGKMELNINRRKCAVLMGAMTCLSFTPGVAQAQQDDAAYRLSQYHELPKCVQVNITDNMLKLLAQNNFRA